MHLFISIFLSFFMFLVVNSAQAMKHRPIENPKRPIEHLLNWAVSMVGNEGQMNTFLRSLYPSENCPPSFAKCFKSSGKPRASVKTSDLLVLLEDGLGDKLPGLLKFHTFSLGFHWNAPENIKKLLADIRAPESNPEKLRQQKSRTTVSVKPSVNVRQAEVRYDPDFQGTCPDMYQVGDNSWMSPSGIGIGGLPSDIRVVQRTDDPDKAEWTRPLTDEEVRQKGLVNFMPLVHARKDLGTQDTTSESTTVDAKKD